MKGFLSDGNILYLAGVCVLQNCINLTKSLKGTFDVYAFYSTLIIPQKETKALNIELLLMIYMLKCLGEVY